MSKKSKSSTTVMGFVLGIILLAGSHGVSVGQTAQGVSPKELAIATASSGGASFPIGAGMSEVIKQSIKGVQARVQTTGGGVESVKLVHEGKTELGTTISYLAYPASSRYSPILEAPTFLSRRLPTILPHSQPNAPPGRTNQGKQ